MEGKNPISLLEEYMVKMKLKSSYSIINQRTGTHINEFTMKLDCGAKWQPVIKTGSSKKEAKYQAAVAMLTQMNIINKVDLNDSKSSLGYISDSSSISSSSPLKSLSAEKSWINVLQELVVNEPYGYPKYNSSSIGPSHNPKFITECKFEDFSVQAEASTKQESKHQAAKKMYELLKNNISKYKTTSSLNTKNENSLNKEITDLVLSKTVDIDTFKVEKFIESQKTSKALKIYSNMNRKKPVKSLEPTFATYYISIKNKLESKKQINLEKKLENLLKVSKKAIDKLTCSDTSEPIELLRELLIHLELTMTINNNRAAKNQHLYGIMLNTSPTINEIGLGETESLAQSTAVFHIAHTLYIILQ